MSDYLVSHPEIDIVAKVTDAPSTEKARTAFLDFLERSGRIPRSQRHYYREGMATKRERLGMDTTHDIEIDYKYEPSGGEEIQQIQAPELTGEDIEISPELGKYIPGGGQPLQQQTLESPIAKIGKELSPIEKLSLGRGSS